MSKKFKKIILIDPHWRDDFVFGPHLGLSYLGAVLKKAGFEVAVIDFVTPTVKTPEVFFEEEEKFMNTIKEFIIGPGERILVGIVCTYLSYPRALKIAGLCKKCNPECTVVLGGPHISAMYQTADWRHQPFLDSWHVDVIAIGEGENTILELAAGNDFANIKGISYRLKNKIIDNPLREHIQNLDIFPFPEWSLWNLKKYPSFLPVTTSRGCLYRCAFCDERLIWGHQYRFRSPKDIIDEIIRNIRVYNCSNIKFVDSSLTMHPRLKEICHLILKNKLKVRWTCFAKVNQVNEELLTLMKKAGCKMLLFGIESGSQRILNLMRKGFLLEDVERAANLSKKVGIPIEGSFIIGFPTETRKEVLQTIELAKKLKLEAYHWHSFFPSIEMLNQPEKWGITFKNFIDWKRFELDKPITIIASEIENNPQLILERHTATFLLENGYKIPQNIEMFSYKNSLSIQEICLLLKQTINETIKIDSSVSMDLGYEVLDDK
jgi:anaerobic magnesium-protoporphyrin IX monomethyl ester cyclase